VLKKFYWPNIQNKVHNCIEIIGLIGTVLLARYWPKPIFSLKKMKKMSNLMNKK